MPGSKLSKENRVYEKLQSFVDEMLDIGGIFGSVNKCTMPNDVEFTYSTKEAYELWHGDAGDFNYDGTIDNTKLHNSSAVKIDEFICRGENFSCFNVVFEHLLYKHYDLEFDRRQMLKKMGPLERTVSKFKSPQRDGKIAEYFALRFTYILTEALVDPDIDEFPLVQDMLDIFKAGGCPVAWRGPLNEIKYFTGPGHYIVYWPHEEKPLLSDRACRTLEQIDNYNNIHKEIVLH